MTPSIPLTTGVTLLIVLLQFATVYHVGKCRHRYGVRAPAVTGHPLFERAYRVQMNTLEWAFMTLPCLWSFAHFVSDGWGAALGGTWFAGRVWYAIAYLREPSSRGPGFMIGALAFGALGLGAGVGVLMAVFGAT